MRYILNILFFSLFILFSESLAAQNGSDEVIRENGRQYILHEVRTGETVYSLTRKYKVDESTFNELNPDVSKGLSIGEFIKVPYNESIDLSASGDQKRGEPDGFIRYRVDSKSETAYFVAKKFNITVEELYAYNPGTTKLKKGKILQIPYWKEKEVATSGETVSTNNEVLEHRVASGETLYSISKFYKVTEDEILHLNPGASNLKAGQVLHIPVKKAETITAVRVPDSNSDSDKYFQHIIESGETLWGTAHHYGVSEEELTALNPILNTGFPAGAVIKIPVKEEIVAVKPVNKDAFKKYEVKNGETLYGVSRKSGVSIVDLKKYNPVLEHRDLVAGETLLIPVEVEEETETLANNENIVLGEKKEADDKDFYRIEVPLEIPESCRPDQSGTYSHGRYNIALFLPFFLEANDTLNREDFVIDTTFISEDFDPGLLEDLQDTTIEIERKELFKKFYGGSENFVQFYEGVLLAVEDLQHKGVDVKLRVFDTKNSADAIRRYISDPEFLNTDLIIGPVYPNVQREVSQISAKNRIPMISPLASQTDLVSTNPYYFQVNPSRDYLAAETAEMVAEEYYNSNFIILKTEDYSRSPEGRIVELLQEKFVNAGLMNARNGVNFTIYDFKAEGPFGLRRIMSKDKENVVYIPSSDEGSLSIAISNVNNLTSEYSITLIGNHRYPNYQSIQLDHYFNLKLKFVAPYWTDYEAPGTIRYITRFKDDFGTEPDNFGMQGYDVTTYFMQAILAYGNDFAKCLPYFHVPLVQGNYHFEKYAQFGGYINRGVSVIEYTRNYDVKRTRTKGVPKLVTAESDY